jgi:hypothetical protein
MTTTTTYNVAPLVEHFADHVAFEVGIPALILLAVLVIVIILWNRRPRWRN